MKYHEKRKHLITKILLIFILLFALFFALFDCAPKPQPQEVVVTFERS